MRKKQTAPVEIPEAQPETIHMPSEAVRKPEPTFLEQQLQESTQPVPGMSIEEDKIIYDILPEIQLTVPYETCVEGMGRLIVQPVKIRRAAIQGKIEIVPFVDPKVQKIPNNVKCFVVAKDKKIHGIQFQDEVVFADEFVPTSKELNGIQYFIPHYNDVLLVSRHIDPGKMTLKKRE